MLSYVAALNSIIPRSESGLAYAVKGIPLSWHGSDYSSITQGPYISRYQSHSSHIKLKLLLDDKQQYHLIHLTTII